MTFPDRTGQGYRTVISKRWRKYWKTQVLRKSASTEAGPLRRRDDRRMEGRKRRSERPESRLKSNSIRADLEPSHRHCYVGWKSRQNKGSHDSGRQSLSDNLAHLIGEH